MRRTISLILFVSISTAAPSVAQEARVYGGAAWTAYTQRHGHNELLGGTKSSVSALFGAWITPRLAIEVEPDFGPTLSADYSYNPSFSVTVHVVTSRRDTSVMFHARSRVWKLEPVFGIGVVHGRTARHATFVNGSPYFDDESSDNTLAFDMGLDAPLSVAPHVEIFPTFRLLAAPRATPADLILSQTGTGAIVLRYGVGARVSF